MTDGVNPAIVVTDAAAAVSEDQPYADPGDADLAAAGAGLMRLVVDDLVGAAEAALGAEVTGVCSTRNAGLVSSIGAAHVIDYTTEDFTDGRALPPTSVDSCEPGVSFTPTR